MSRLHAAYYVLLSVEFRSSIFTTEYIVVGLACCCFFSHSLFRPSAYETRLNPTRLHSRRVLRQALLRKKLGADAKSSAFAAEHFDVNTRDLQISPLFSDPSFRLFRSPFFESCERSG